MKTYKDISSYIKSFPKDVQLILRKLREVIQKAAPKATETIKYSIPTFVLHKNLVHFGAYEHHIGFYPTPGGIKVFEKELSKYKTSKGAVQFPIHKPIPFALVTKIVKFRVKEDDLLFKK